MAKSETVKLTAPNGASVTVGAERVASLIRFGFTEAAEPVKKAAAKKATPSKSTSSK